MRTVTVDDVMSWEPCMLYTTERVTSLLAGRARVTALDICAMDIPAEDILWAVLREDMIEDRVLHLFACWCAERALIAEREAGHEPDPASWAAVEVKRRWVDGAASDDELEFARAAVRAAARVAAWETVWATSWNAARAATRAAAWDAARAAAWSIARAAALDEQLRRLVEMLEEVPR